MKKLIIFVFVLLSLTTVQSKTITENGGDGYFYTALAPYGEWIELNDGMTVWQPTMMPRNWEVPVRGSHGLLPLRRGSAGGILCGKRDRLGGRRDRRLFHAGRVRRPGRGPLGRRCGRPYKREYQGRHFAPERGALGLEQHPGKKGMRRKLGTADIAGVIPCREPEAPRLKGGPVRGIESVAAAVPLVCARPPVRRTQEAALGKLDISRLFDERASEPRHHERGPVWIGLGVVRVRYARSEEHTSELQSLRHLVCRLLLEKKKTKRVNYNKS